MTRFLIVNADDYARTAEVSAGIREAHRNGLVTTTTILINLPGALEFLDSAIKQTPTLAIGLHLNLTLGKPCWSGKLLPDLVGLNGQFHPVQDWYEDPSLVPIESIEIEWRTQIETLASTGTEIDHLDSHHHVATFRPDTWRLFLDLAAELGCGVRLPIPDDIQPEELQRSFPPSIIRNAQKVALPELKASTIPHPDYFLASFFDESATFDRLEILLNNLPLGVSELMCHPGYTSTALKETSGYAHQRIRELEILTDPKILDLVKDLDIKLCTYKQVWKND